VIARCPDHRAVAHYRDEWDSIIRKTLSNKVAQSEYADLIRIVRGDRDAGHLRAGEPQHLVYPGIRRSLRAGFCLWISAGGVAFWSGRGHLVGRCRAPLVSGKKVMLHQSLFNPSSAATL